MNFFIILAMFQLPSCGAQDLLSTNLAQEELDWKNQWTNIFFHEYRYYRDTLLIDCHDNNRDIAFDIERKIKVIDQLPLGLVLKGMKELIVKKSIEYDSLIMIINHSPLYEGEFNFTPVSFFIFNKDERNHRLVSFFDADLQPYFKEYKEEFSTYYESINALQNGCGYGFITMTRFGKDLKEWEIKRMIINVDE